tara:strand:+ start:1145 stop:1690 length:546 start_codon:yes stop_codon:yes gene_type:complete
MTFVLPVGFMTSGILNNDTPSVVGISAVQWNNGFETVARIPSSTEGYISYTSRRYNILGQSSYAMVGLSRASDPVVTSYTGIRYVLYTANTLEVWQSGTRKYYGRTYTDGDTVSLHRSASGVITYRHKGVIFYTSTINDTAEMKGDGSLSKTHDRAENIILNNGTDTFNPEFDNKVNVAEY